MRELLLGRVSLGKKHCSIVAVSFICFPKVCKMHMKLLKFKCSSSPILHVFVERVYVRCTVHTRWVCLFSVDLSLVCMGVFLRTSGSGYPPKNRPVLVAVGGETW